MSMIPSSSARHSRSALAASRTGGQHLKLGLPVGDLLGVQRQVVRTGLHREAYAVQPRRGDRRQGLGAGQVDEMGPAAGLPRGRDHGVDRRGLRGAQRGAQRVGIVRFDGCDAAGPETEALQDGIGQGDGARQSTKIVVRSRAHEKTNRRHTVSKSRSNGLESHLRDLVDGQRKCVGRQAVAEARQRVDQRRAVRIIVQQHNRSLSPASR